jgi:hypothetical protein
MRSWLVVVIALVPVQAWAACPPGTFPFIDTFGNNICKSFDGGATRSIEGNTRNCPPGTLPAMDRYGNNVCQSIQNGQRFYDTSRGCPAGTIPWVDTYGNDVCRRM